MKILQTAQGTVLLHHRGQLFAGRLSGSVASVSVSPEDLPLLAEFLVPNDATEVARKLIGQGVPREILARAVGRV